ncbi:MAG: hypothetical protein QNJ19_01585 [Woeseiaceae bacterium]|nr:hypothetical protein [Woeseiaceae bacterium]
MRILATILLGLMLSGCTGMLLGGDVAPADDTTEDEESKKR